MKRLFFLVLFLNASISVHAQVKALDKLEVLYDQGHYKMVVSKANRLLDQPDYDYSYKPEFYKSLALFQLADKGLWGMLHKNALQEARELLSIVTSSPEGMRIVNTHLNHVVRLKSDLVRRSLEYKSAGETDKYEEIQQILFGFFEQIPSLDGPNDVKQPKVEETVVETNPKSNEKRDKVVEYAQKCLGSPYKWAGTDPKGFDCSGFTTYVMQEFGVILERRAEDQYTKSAKIKAQNAQKGDLVFFNNGSGISHVGIIISEKGEPLKMIHASSSKGVIITNIEESEYWLKRLYGFGTYL